MKIGVTAPGSSTHFMVLYMMAQAGLKPEDASFIGTGSGNTVVAAVKRGEVDAISNADPMIDDFGPRRRREDRRRHAHAEGTQAVYGGPYPAAVLYTTAAFVEKNPNTAQALVTALVRGLKWVQTPLAGRDRQDDAGGIRARQQGRSTSSRSRPTCRPIRPTARFTREAAETAYKVLKAFDPNVQSATIDLAKTYTDTFVTRGECGALDGVVIPASDRPQAVAPSRDP